MSRGVFLAGLFTLAAFCVSAQFDPDVKKIIPPTPNAASLGKFGNIPVGLYTGQPNVSFPLFDIEYNDLSVPISLSYSYSGFKVEEHPSWVGMGWTLNGTGVINRQQRGLPDESTSGYNGLNQNGINAVNYINSPGSGSHTTYLDGVRKGQRDSEPDVFIFSFPGHSGKFFFDETQCGTAVKQATVIPHQKLKVIGHFNYYGIYNHTPGIIEKFVVTDEKGVIYTFNVVEKGAETEPGDPDAQDFANTWYLSSIETPFGNTVNYHYRFRVMDLPATVYEQRIIPLAHPENVPTSHAPTKQFTPSSVNEAVLERITFRHGAVEFIEGEEREDWNSDSWVYKKGLATEQPKTLSKIKITISGRVAKEFEFSYSYFGSNDRLRLDSFREINQHSKFEEVTVAKPPYVFTYEGGTFPAIGNENGLFRQDHWGYYRGSNATTLLPPYSDRVEGSNGSTVFINISGNSREPSPSDASNGILTKITYPTLGYTTFEYEPNEYFKENDDSGFNLCSGDFEIKGKEAEATVETFGDDYKNIEVTLSAKACVKVHYTLHTPCIDGLASVTLWDPQGIKILEHIQEKRMSGLFYSNSGPDDGETFVLEPGTYILQAAAINENSCQPENATNAWASFHKVIAASEEGANVKAGGLRISSVSDCTDDTHCVTKYYQYHDIDNPLRSSGKLINEPVYHYYQRVMHDDGGDIGTGGTMFYDLLCSVLVANSEVPLATASGGVLGYKYVTVTEEIGGSRGRTEYRFNAADEFEDEGSMEYPFPPRVSNEWKRGLQRFKKDFVSTGPTTSDIIAVQQTDYCLNDVYNRQIGFKPKKLRDTQSGRYPLTLADYTFVPYPAESGWSAPCSSSDTQYSYETGTQQDVTISKTLSYGNPLHMQVTEIETINSEDETLKTTLKYVEDVGAISGLTPEEASGIQSNRNKLSLIEKQEYKNGTLLSTTRNIYQGPHLKKVKYATRNNLLKDYVTYNEYDTYGNVLNYTTLKGEFNSYQWDHDGKLPVVEAKNAHQTDVFFTSFEDIGALFEDANKNNLAFSGTRVHDSERYTIPASYTPSNPSNTVMSYWYWDTDQWKFSGTLPFSPTIISPGTKLDEIRAYPKGAFITTLTYDPARGVTGVTDVNGISSHYEYDELRRLVRVRDYKGNVLKEFSYHYKSE
jgi:YD repeat-containing protein